MPESASIGIWGQRRRQYLREHRKILYNDLLLSGKLDSHLSEVGAQAEGMLFQLVKQMMEQEGITKQLKADNQMEWVGRTNSIHHRAEENILRELIYGEDVVINTFIFWPEDIIRGVSFSSAVVYSHESPPTGVLIPVNLTPIFVPSWILGYVFDPLPNQKHLHMRYIRNHQSL